MNYQPLLRDYRQMVRVVRDNANSALSYQLGTAYGETTDQRVNSTEQQIRTLNAMNLPSTSPRRPELPAVNGFLSTRASSSHYHDLNDNTQQFINGQGGPQAVRRGDGDAGTKMRTEIGRDAFSKKVFTAQPLATQTHSSQQPSPGQTGDKKSTPSQQNTHFTGGFNAFK